MSNIWLAKQSVFFFLFSAIESLRRAMTRDTAMYPEPDEFKPERYFTKDGKLNDDSQILTFGFGRRYVYFDSLVTLIQT